MSRDVFNKELDRIYGVGKPDRELVDEAHEASYYLIRCEAEVKRLQARVEALEGVIDKALDEDYIGNEWLQQAIAATEQGESDE